MEKNNPVIDQTLFDLKLNEAKFYSDQGLYDEADKIYINLINELKQLPQTKSSDIQIRQLESIRQEYQAKINEDQPAVLKPTELIDDTRLDTLDELLLFSESGYVDIENRHELHQTDDSSNQTSKHKNSMSGQAKISSHKREIEVDDNTDDKIDLFVNEMIIQACQKEATAIHIEPSSISSQAVIRFRVDGICQRYTKISNKFALRVIFKIKVLAKMDITIRARTLGGKIKFKSEQTGAIYLQVTTIPTIGYKEDLVLKFLQVMEPMSLQQLGFLDHTLDPFVKMINKPSGLILVAGHADSGKTTTLHSSLKLINMPEKKIWSAEDPVQISHKGIRQSEVKSHKDSGYPLLLKTFIKTDPDVIMLQEVENHETASLALKASLTGSLLFVGINASSALDTIRKVLEMGVNPVHFADSLLCVLAQRLVRRLCQKCKKPSSSYSFEMLADEFGEDPDGLLSSVDNSSIALYDHDPDGCIHCGYTGYKGRIAIHDLMINTDTIKTLIKEIVAVVPQEPVLTEIVHDGCKDSKSLFQKIDDAVKKMQPLAVRNGSCILKQDGLLKVIAGITDIAEIRRKCL